MWLDLNLPLEAQFAVKALKDAARALPKEQLLKYFDDLIFQLEVQKHVTKQLLNYVVKLEMDNVTNNTNTSTSDSSTSQQ